MQHLFLGSIAVCCYLALAADTHAQAFRSSLSGDELWKQCQVAAAATEGHDALAPQDIAAAAYCAGYIDIARRSG